ncbi:hypothetical protein [Rhodospirillum centenum]|nr:hypothetical protein [Rhodospirillum centenum]
MLDHALHDLLHDHGVAPHPALPAVSRPAAASLAAATPAAQAITPARPPAPVHPAVLDGFLSPALLALAAAPLVAVSPVLWAPPFWVLALMMPRGDRRA